MKSIQFIYEDTEIHFLVNPDQENEKTRAIRNQLNLFNKENL